MVSQASNLCLSHPVSPPSVFPDRVHGLHSVPMNVLNFLKRRSGLRFLRRTAMALLEATIFNVSLPAIGRDLDADIGLAVDSQWLRADPAVPDPAAARSVATTDEGELQTWEWRYS